MADFLSELNRRLTQIDKREDFENQRHEAAMTAIQRDRKTIVDMIALEKGDTGQPDFFVAKTQPGREATIGELENEILRALENQRDWQHSDLKAALIAKGLGDASDPNFGRRVQGTLLSLLSRDLAAKAGKRLWRIGKKYTAAMVA